MVIDLNKKALTDIVSDKTGLTKKAAIDAVDAVFETITETLHKGGTVDIYGFGKFEVKNRAARNGVNPITKEKMYINEVKIPSFKASKNLKDSVK